MVAVHLERVDMCVWPAADKACPPWPQVERAEKEWEEADERAKKLEEEARQARCTLTVH
jgi:hypothetical protein